MLGMVQKEFIVQRLIVVTYVVVAIFLGVQVMAGEMPPAAVTMLAIIFTFSTVGTEDRYNSHVFINSLPVTRSEIVTAKYVFHIAVGLCLVGVSSLVRAAGGGLTLKDALLHLLVSADVIVVFRTLFFPVYYRLGPRFVQIGLFVLLFMLFTAAPIVYNVGVKHNFWGIPDVLRSLPLWPLYTALTGGAAGLLLVSRRVSVWLYRRKEF